MLEPTDKGEDNGPGDLPPIPGKRYFTIGEVSELCGVKPHVLRYWEQEFPQLKPVKRRGNRRYYQRHDVLMVRQIRNLLYEQGFTIGGARLQLQRRGRQERLESDPPDPAPDARRSSKTSFSCCGVDSRRASTYYCLSYRGVAQPGSAPEWGSGGRRFKSSRPDQ